MGYTPVIPPATFEIGTTSGAPVAGTSVWTRPEFAGRSVTIFLGNTQIDLIDLGNSNIYTSKTLSSTTLTINNYVWQTGDNVSYIVQ